MYLEYPAPVASLKLLCNSLEPMGNMYGGCCRPAHYYFSYNPSWYSCQITWYTYGLHYNLLSSCFPSWYLYRGTPVHWYFKPQWLFFSLSHGFYTMCNYVHWLFQHWYFLNGFLYPRYLILGYFRSLYLMTFPLLLLVLITMSWIDHHIL